MARVCEGADLGLVAGDGGRERLLGLAVDEFAKVESSIIGVSLGCKAGNEVELGNQVELTL